MAKRTPEEGKEQSVRGFAYQHIIVGILMKKYGNVSLVDLPHSKFDIILALPQPNQAENLIRVQVKTTIQNYAKFEAGGRGGVDRTYKSDSKQYIYTTKDADIVISCQIDDAKDNFLLYFIPTILIEKWAAKTKSFSLIAPLCNNYEMLENCKDQEWVLNKAKEYGLI